MASKVILVCNDASKALRESGVHIVRVPRMAAETVQINAPRRHAHKRWSMR